jgi:hypothetical protein
MRFAVQYKSKSGVVGLCLFRADSFFEALEYLDAMRNHGHSHVFNLNQLEEGSIDELYRIFPRVVSSGEQGVEKGG